MTKKKKAIYRNICRDCKSQTENKTFDKIENLCFICKSYQINATTASIHADFAKRSGKKKYDVTENYD